MKKGIKKKKKGRRITRFLAWSIIGSSLLFLAAVGGLSVYGAVALSPEEDERLFREAGADSFTRFYYHAEGGESVAALPGFQAVEWESERLSSSEKCLYTPIEEMPDYLGNAFVAVEDHRFYRHSGVDVLRTGKAALNSVFHFSPRFGGSTITQQLIKNIGGEREQTASRKIREMLRARALEKRHTKEEILEAYLNIVPMSDGCIGVGTASLLYFGKEPRELTLAEAASIAAVTRAPSVYAPTKNTEKHLERRNTVLWRMKECGMISEAVYEEAKNEPLVLQNGLKSGESVRSWYTETVIDDVKKALLSEGYTEASATALLYRGGLRIYTAVDIGAQRAAEKHFENGEAFSGYGEDLNAALVLLSPQNGNLAAIVGNRGKKEGNRLLNHAKDALYAPGSALKPVALYAPAVEDGKISEATVFDDVPSSFTGTTPWPRNAPDVYSGLTDCTRALSLSKNTAAVSVYGLLGAERIYSALTAVGIDTLVRRRSTAGGVLTDLAPAPLALGELTDGVSLLSLTRAYLPLADEGNLHGVRSYLLVLDRDGRVLLSPKEEEQTVYTKETASVLTHMLQSVAEEGSAAALTLPQIVATAGKTGTSAGGKNRIFIGYTPYYLGGVLCTYGDGRAVTGEVHLSVFDAVMKEIHAPLCEEGAEDFKMASGLRAVRVCRDSGKKCSSLCHMDPRGEREITVWVKEEDIPRENCDCHTAFWYDEEGDGVVLEPALYGGVPLTRISLLKVKGRDFPVDIAVTDAEYTVRDIGDAAPSSRDEAYYASVLDEGHYAGRRADGGRPYNALSRSIVGEPERKAFPLPQEKREKHADPNAPRTDGLLPSSPGKKQKEKRRAPLERFFGWLS